MSQPFWGKYRGVVTNNIDPEQRGRIQVIVPAVTGTSPSNWALPCMPVAGISEGFFAIPPLQASVWVEYEDGDSNKPIWVGGFWGQQSEVPTTASGPAAADSSGAEHRDPDDWTGIHVGDPQRFCSDTGQRRNFRLPAPPVPRSSSTTAVYTFQTEKARKSPWSVQRSR